MNSNVLHLEESQTATREILAVGINLISGMCFLLSKRFLFSPMYTL